MESRTRAGSSISPSMALVFTTFGGESVKGGLLPEVESRGLHAAQEIFLEVADPAELGGEGAVIPGEGGPVQAVGAGIGAACPESVSR